MRGPTIIVAVILGACVAACFPVEVDLLQPVIGGKTVVKVVDAAEPMPDAMVEIDAQVACVPELEICNGIDDDCDGEVDEAVAADLYCETRIVNAVTFCDDGKGVCVPVKCRAGFLQCDGDPGNGCEPACECDGTSCEDMDAGEDAGI